MLLLLNPQGPKHGCQPCIYILLDQPRLNYVRYADSVSFHLPNSHHKFLITLHNMTPNDFHLQGSALLLQVRFHQTSCLVSPIAKESDPYTFSYKVEKFRGTVDYRSPITYPINWVTGSITEECLF